MSSKSTLACASVVAAVFTAPVTADFVGVTISDESSAVGTPDGLTTYRLYALFSSPTDQLLAVAGSDVTTLSFSIDGPGGLYNDAGPIAGLKQEDFAYGPITAAWDSWVTIDHEGFVGNDANYSPTFLNNDGVNSVLVDGLTSFTDDNDGWYDSNPGTPALAGPDGRILIAQFTVASGTTVTLSGEIQWLSEGGGFQKSPFELDGCDDYDYSYTIDPACPPADVDTSKHIDTSDLLAVLSAWGPCDAAFTVTDQERSVVRSGQTCSDECGGTCTCWSHVYEAAGLGRFQHAGVLSIIRDDGFELDALQWVSSSCHGAGSYSRAHSTVQLEFDVHTPTPFTFAAEIVHVYGSVDDIHLTGPGGFELRSPVDTAGTLAPGSYALRAEWDVSFGDEYSGSTFATYTLTFDGTRCAADADVDGDVGFPDLLAVLFAWGPCP